jgi:hypothetical protein
MKSQKVIILVVILLGSIFIAGEVAGLYYLFWHKYPIVPTLLVFLEVQERRVNLLYKTDHHALLEACRELSRRASAGDLKYKTYYGGPADADLEFSSFPKAILDLEPGYVDIQEGWVIMVALAGGLDHFGVRAYPPDYKEPPFLGFKLGDKKLIDGLWYYDEGYDENPEYDKKVESWRPKGARN